MKQPINKRLLSASEFVRQDAYLADIGTDHAYLPLFLLAEGRIRAAICADINEGPLKNARRNAKEAELTDKISFVLTDGAASLCDSGATDYTICGMGGELIRDIIEKAPHLKNSAIRLILQPMSRQAHLRRYLARAGFRTVSEGYSSDGGKHYLFIVAEYDGVQRELSDFEAEFGFFTKNGLENSQAMRKYFDTKISALKKAAEGKAAAGEDNSFEVKLLKEYSERISKNDG